MLIRNFRCTGPCIPVARLQYVAAIIVGIKGFSEIEEAILNTSTQKMQEYVNGLVKQAGTKYINYAAAVTEYLATVNCLEYRGRLHNLYTLIGENKSRFNMSKESFTKDMLRYIRDYSSVRLNRVFLHTSACKKMINNKIIQEFRSMHLNNAGTILSTAKINAVFNEFAEYFSRYSANIPYNSNNDNPFGWVATSFSYFSMDKSHLTNVVNERNQDAVIGDDKGSTMLELASIEATKDEYVIDFPDVITKIAKASNLLYSHKQRKIAYYDIFSYYVSICANELIGKINKSLGVDSQMIYLKNGWETIDEVASHIWNKFHSRNLFARVMVTLVDVNTPITEISKLYKRVMHANDAIQLNNAGAIKDGMRLFDSKNVSVRSKAKNGEKFEILYNGFTALREFVMYLEHRGITIFSISPEIFRDLDITKRYRTLDEYLLLADRVHKLYKAAEHNEDIIDGIYSNDKIYDMVSVNFNDTTVLYNYLKSSCRLCDIKKALQEVENIKERQVYDKISVDLYMKYLQEDDYVGLTVTKTGSYVDHDFLATRQKINRFRAIMNSGNAANYRLIPIYPRKECYITTIDVNDLNDMTAEYRKSFIASYDRTLSVIEKYVISVGGLDKMDDKTLSALYYWFIPFFRDEIKDVNNGANVDKNPTKYFTFLNILEELMRREGHPTMQDGYYNLNKKSLREEFSYLLNEENGNTLIDIRIQCIKHCAVMLNITSDNEFDLFHDLWIYSSIMQFLRRKTVKTLADISHQQRAIPNSEESMRISYLSEYESWKYDGPFASLVRATAHYSYICMNNQISSITEFPFLGSVALYGVKPSEVDDYSKCESHVKELVIDTVNKYIEEHDDLFAFFKDLENEMDLQFKSSSISHIKTTEYDQLLKQAANSLSTTIQQGNENDDFAIRLRKHIVAVATTDSLGYVLAYNNRFMLPGKDGRKIFLHSYGYWVCVDNDNVEIKPVTYKDYTNYIKGNLDV